MSRRRRGRVFADTVASLSEESERTGLGVELEKQEQQLMLLDTVRHPRIMEEIKIIQGD